MQNGDAAQLTIADNGIGIAEENIPRIFEPYYTRKRTGAGLGLPFSLNIMKAHGATIDVKSKIGVGTTFVITFPPADTGA
jgi:signal transduction histidine kinase